MIRRLIGAAVVGAIVLVGVVSVVLAVFRTSLYDHYLAGLDTWVQKGGDVGTLQADVVETCGKLVMSQSGVFQNFKFLTYARDDFDFYVDVCTKMTVNRVHKQPEFEKPQIVASLCGPSSEVFFRKLCLRSGL
jgi:hypothetical protein